MLYDIFPCNLYGKCHRGTVFKEMLLLKSSVIMYHRQDNRKKQRVQGCRIDSP